MVYPVSFLIYEGTNQEQLVYAHTRAEVLHWKRFKLGEKWATNLYKATQAVGIRYDLPLEAVITGRVLGFKLRAHEHTEALLAFLHSKNNLHLIPFDFQGKPNLTIEGSRIVCTIGLPTPLVETSIILPVSDVYGLETGQFLVGVDLMNKPLMGQFSDSMPHLLVAGATGSGKTVFIRSLVYQLSQTDCLLALGDGKMGACLRGYEKLPGVVGSLAIDDAEIREMVSWVNGQMRERYTRLNRGESLEDEPPIVCVIDEISDLPPDIMDSLNVIARKGRESKTHLVLSTQNPTQKNLGNDLRRNIVGRVALRVEDSTASSVILPSEYDASTLMGSGDGFFYDGQKTTRVQCYLLDKHEAQLEMCYTPAIQWGQDTDSPARATPQSIDQLSREDYAEMRRNEAVTFMRENPNAGQVELGNYLRERGIKFGGTTLNSLYREKKSIYPLS